MTKQTEQVKCPHCGGDGLYKRHTPYTVDGKPVCFRCGGSGYLERPKRNYTRHAKWQISGPYCPWPRLALPDDFEPPA